MLNYLLSARAGWMCAKELLFWRIGDKFTIKALFEDGELVDFSIEGIQTETESLHRFRYTGNAIFDEEAEFYLQEVAQRKPIYLIVEDMLVNFYHALVDDFDQQTHYLILDNTARNKTLIVSVLDSDEEIVLVTSNKLLFNVVP